MLNFIISYYLSSVANCQMNLNEMHHSCWQIANVDACGSAFNCLHYLEFRLSLTN